MDRLLKAANKVTTLDVPCPKCGAGIGSRCGPKGHFPVLNHFHRLVFKTDLIRSHPEIVTRPRIRYARKP